MLPSINKQGGKFELLTNIYNHLQQTLVRRTSMAASKVRLQPLGAHSLNCLQTAKVNTVNIVHCHYYYLSCACYFRTYRSILIYDTN